MDREKILNDILDYSGVPAEDVSSLKDLIKGTQIYTSKSDMLFRFGTMNQLMFDCFAPYLDVFLVLADPETKETVSFTHAAKTDGMEEGWDKSEKAIDYLIYDLVAASSTSSRIDVDGQKVGNVLLTVIMNVAARYCTLGDNYKESFEKCIDHWKKFKEREQEKKDQEYKEETS